MPYVKAKDGVDIYYEVSGHGTPFLFFSETACDGAVWNIYQTPEFARDHRVIILDYRGTGLSGKPSRSTAQTCSPMMRRQFSIISASKTRLFAATLWAGESLNFLPSIIRAKSANSSSHPAAPRTRVTEASRYGSQRDGRDGL